MEKWYGLSVLTYLAGSILISAVLVYCYYLYKRRGDRVAGRLIPGILLVDFGGMIFLVRNLGWIPSTSFALAKWSGLLLTLTGMFLVVREWRQRRGEEKSRETG